LAPQASQYIKTVSWTHETVYFEVLEVAYRLKFRGIVGNRCKISELQSKPPEPILSEIYEEERKGTFGKMKGELDYVIMH
jgi:hypothetical protein